MTKYDEFKQEYTRAFDHLIDAVRHRLAENPLPVLATVAAPPGQEKQAAAHEVWTLFQRGFQYLREPAGGEPLAGALRRVSLRNVRLAALVRPPDFRQTVFDFGGGSGRDAALLSGAHLISAAESDLPVSVEIIRESLGAVGRRAEMGVLGPTFSAEAATRALSWLDLLADTYRDACREMRRDLEAAGFRPPRTYLDIRNVRPSGPAN